MHRTWIITAALALALLGATRASAQLAPAPSVVAQAAPAAPRGPILADAAIAPRLHLSGADEADATAAARRPFGTSQTLMIVGGATLLAGAIIGGDAGTIMMVGGAGIGLYGLYLFLREPSSEDGARAVGVGYRVPIGP
jgi:hypothetical protein